MSAAPFITFEGGEGAGKTTQIALLRDFLTTTGKSVVTTREPGGSPGAEAIRALLLQGNPDGFEGITEVLLHYAARRDHLHTTVLPALNNGQWVICDRFADSTAAYQGDAMGVDRSAISIIHDVAVGAFAPNLTLILDVPPEVGMERMKARGENPDRYERMDLDFHRHVREGFLRIADAEPNRCIVIDASRGVDDIASDIVAAVRSRLAAYLEA